MKKSTVEVVCRVLRVRERASVKKKTIVRAPLSIVEIVCCVFFFAREQAHEQKTV